MRLECRDTVSQLSFLQEKKLLGSAALRQNTCKSYALLAVTIIIQTVHFLTKSKDLTRNRVCFHK